MEGAGDLWWANQPTQSPPTACHWPSSCLPHRFEWAPIVTTLPDLLGSGISLIARKPIYLEIDIPSPPMEEPDQKRLPLEDIPTTLITGPSKSPPKSKVSMMAEVCNLLS